VTISNPPHDKTAPAETPLADALSFIETQFPVAKISMESYKERMAAQGQTLTGLGRWWGRKPLVLVRACLLGLLLPATDDPVADREIFLKLMTMDAAGLHRRKSKAIPGERLLAELLTLPPGVRRRFLQADAAPEQPELAQLSREDRAALQEIVFARMSYVEKLQYCDRPEQVDGPDEETWTAINAHISTQATSLTELSAVLGERRFGHRPRVGDAFCGGGSIPFEAARLGCDAYGSDLNPVAVLLTWAGLHVAGGGPDVAESVADAQRQVFDAVDRRITEWGIEHNSLGWRADTYLYCAEVRDPESGWYIPLAPNWVVAKRYEKSRTIADLIPDPENKRYDIAIREGVSAQELAQAQAGGTVASSRLVPPSGGPSTPIDAIRQGLRMWDAEDVTPRPDDIFQERLYCIRWVETYTDTKGNLRTRRHYRAPSPEDFKREERVLELLRDRFSDWQEKGYIPSRRIEPGDKTDEPIRTRGWTHWHHLFTPRQLLLLGLFGEELDKMKLDKRQKALNLLSIGRICNYNSRLCRWNSAMDKASDVFSNQALNTLYDYVSRGLTALESTWFVPLSGDKFSTSLVAEPNDCRDVTTANDIWITDPPYADAVNYHELSEFFLAWQEKAVRSLFPNWYADTKRSLAVSGSDMSFRQSMVDCYSNLAAHMPANGMQVVMFTHQDTGVWADLTMIMWAAGLRVTAAWTIATETGSALRQGNYVQGTVLLVLRKCTETEPVFLDEITHEIEAEVRRQLDSMTALEDDSDPNFGDADYQLAAYAAALRVLTARPIYEIDPAKEILRERPRGEVGIVEQLIRDAVKIACDHLVPRDFDADLWKTLSPAERFYCKGVEVESHGEYRSGVYQELARGFGAADYTDLMGNTRANETRLKTPSEFGRRMLSGDGFGGTLLRQVLFAVQLSAKSEETRDGLNYLKTERPDYWNERAKIIQLLGYLARLRDVAGMDHWRKDAAAADLLAGAVRNDHV
jgi:putative DNA methylase